MSAAGGPADAGNVDEAQMQAYLEQLRAADPAELIAQAFSMLGTGAEVKLGRPDARLLIDGLAGLTEAVADRLGDQLGTQMRNAVGQLQTAQVRAEGAQPGAAGPGAPGGPPGPTQPGQAGPAQGQPTTSEPQPRSSRLWVPGQ